MLKGISLVVLVSILDPIAWLLNDPVMGNALMLMMSMLLLSLSYKEKA